MSVKVHPPAKHKIQEIKDISQLLSEKDQHYFWLQGTMSIQIMHQSFWYMCCSICNKSSHVDFDELYQCLYCKCEGARGKPRAKAYVQVHDSTGCIDATMIGETGEAFLQCTSDTLMQLTTQENQSVAQSIRTSIDDEHILYVRATERNVDGIHVKYDVVFLIDPVTELDTTMRPETSSDVIPGFRGNSFSRCRKGKQIVKPIKRALFSLKDSDSSQDEEHERLTDNIIPSQLGENTEHSVVGDFSEEDDIPVQQQ
ncbi:Replication factor-A C terminal domain-containing protein [Forsythia ovata]|uniref:Replication factor-A C terminal domain-containing protein n=1 Tax=Forsythia ovata TaxID=205694 RepID=A0ABD1T6Y5_9LAMI